LPIHLEPKSAAVHPFALRDRLRDAFLRRGWHSYGLARLSRRRCHLMISLGRRDIKILLKATNDAAQRALTRFRRGCARIATGYLAGGGRRGSRQMEGPRRARRGRIAVHQAQSKQRVRSKLRTTWVSAFSRVLRSDGFFIRLATLHLTKKRPRVASSS